MIIIEEIVNGEVVERELYLDPEALPAAIAAITNLYCDLRDQLPVVESIVRRFVENPTARIEMEQNKLCSALLSNLIGTVAQFVTEGDTITNAFTETDEEADLLPAVTAALEILRSRDGCVPSCACFDDGHIRTWAEIDGVRVCPAHTTLEDVPWDVPIRHLNGDTFDLEPHNLKVDREIH
jgi:hypothetical protein